MVFTLDVPCFRYVGVDLKARLAIEEDSTGKRLVLCPVRKALYLLTPEEHVRQALVWFLIEGSRSASAWGQQLRFLVERSSLDVSAFHGRAPTERHFSPNIPVVIFETKRIEHNSENNRATDDQIKRYMIRERCRAGFIFNGRQAAWLSLAGQFNAPIWTKTTISDLSEVEERINGEASQVAAYVSECELTFARAAVGDFDAMAKLVMELGNTGGLTFFLSLKTDGNIGLIRAYHLRVENENLITFRARSAGSKNRLELAREQFHSLRSVEPLV